MSFDPVRAFFGSPLDDLDATATAEFSEPVPSTWRTDFSVTLQVSSSATTEPSPGIVLGEDRVRYEVGPVTIESSSALGWGIAIQGGLRFRHSQHPHVFLVGHGAGHIFEPHEVAEGFYDFASRWGSVDAFAHLCLGWTSPEKPGSVPASLEDEAPPVREALLDLFEDVAGERFEFGEDSEFDTRLQRLISGSGNVALDLLFDIVVDLQVPGREAATRALSVVARSDVGLREERFAFLTRVLTHPKASMRDAAALALFDFGSEKALGPLREAENKEESPLVRKNIRQIIAAIDA